MQITENTKEISNSLNEVDRQWQFYKPKFENIEKDNYVPRIIHVITEGMLNDMDKITILYEKSEHF